MVRGEVTYKGNSFAPPKWKFGWGQNLVKCFKLAREPHAPSKNRNNNWAQNGPEPKFGPMGPTVTALGDITGSPMR